MPKKQRISVGFSNAFIYLKSLINKGKTLKTIEILFKHENIFCCKTSANPAGYSVLKTEEKQ